MGDTKSRRMQQVLSELEEAAGVLDERRDQFGAARIGYELALKRYKHAFDYFREEVDMEDARGDPKGVLPLLAENEILNRHVFTAMSLGEAMTVMLIEDSDPVALDDIVQRLDERGYQFQTGFPLREVNAGLLNLKVVEKVGEDGYILRPQPLPVEEADM